MAGNEGKAAPRKAQTAAVSTQHSAIGKTGKPNHKSKSKSKTLEKRTRRGKQFLRFRDARGKTVEFVEMCTDADFPCVEIGFADKTALHFLMGARLTMEPAYSDWKTGDQRLLREWPAQETS